MKKSPVRPAALVSVIAGVAAVALTAAPAHAAPAAAGSAQGVCGAGCGTYRPVTFETGRTPTRALNVSVTGDDTTADGSTDHPYRTPAAALEAATPGTEVRVHAGTYGGYQYVNNGTNGTKDAPIWIDGAPGEARPLLTGQLQIDKFHYLVVSGLEFAFTGSHGLQLTDGADRADTDAARDVVVRDNYFHDLDSSFLAGIKMAGVNSFWVLHNQFANCSTGGQHIDMVGDHDGEILGNTFSNNLAGLADLMIKGGSRDIEVRGNTFTDAANTGDTAVWLGGGGTGGAFFRPALSLTEPNYQAVNIKIVGNVMTGGRSAVRESGDLNTLVAHNTIVDPRDFVGRILQEDISEVDNGVTYPIALTKGAHWTGNIVSFDAGKLSRLPDGRPEYINMGAGLADAAATYTYSQNLWYAHDDPAESRPTDLPSKEKLPIYADPRFVNAAAGDYHLGTWSPARLTALLLPDIYGPHYFTTDVEGRNYGWPLSNRGAYAS